LNTSQAINGEVKPGDWVIAAGNNDYAYLIGQVTSIENHGTPEHGTANETDDIHVDFTAFDYPPECVTEIEKHFSDLYGETMSFDEIALDDVIMSPKMLIEIDYLGQNERTRMGSERIFCESYCNRFPGNRESPFSKYWELAERFDKNFSDYREMVMGYEKWAIIDMADRISAMSNAHEYMTSVHRFSGDEIDFFLKLKDPLEVVADALCLRNADNSVDINSALYDVYDKQDVLADYPLVGDMNRPNGIPSVYLQKLSDKLAEIRKPLEQSAEKPAPSEKPKPSFTDKLMAAQKLVGEQDALNAGKAATKTITPDRGER